MLKNTKNTITPKGIYDILKRDWKLNHIGSKRSQLDKLGFSEVEVNWLLNSIEWKYQIDIEVERISLKTTLEEFVLRVIDRSKLHQ